MKRPDFFQELIEEFQTVFTGRHKFIDTVIPPIIYLVINAWIGFTYAVWSAIIVSLLIGIYRIIKHEPFAYAAGGLGAVIIAALIALITGKSEGFFIWGIFTQLVLIVLCLVSVIIGKPLVAWTSFIARRWPLKWYWHERVRPAYNEVTLAWAVYFGLQTLPQINLLQSHATTALGIFQLISGWPGTIVLLGLSYLYGTWRLQKLHGPSVKEFIEGAEPPWEGQKRGF